MAIFPNEGGFAMHLHSPFARNASSKIKAAVLGGTLSFLLALPAGAQRKQLDVPYVPTPTEVVNKMLDLAEVGEGDYVIDLGSGDGRIAIGAAERGAKALGVDLNPERISEANENARRSSAKDRVEFKQADLFQTDFSKANVLTLYLLQSVNEKLRPRILEMPAGTRVVSHAFNMDDWEPDQAVKVDGRDVYYWVVPARVAGTWRVQNGGKTFSVTFDQQYQKLAGSAQIDGKQVPISEGSLSGDRISFSIGSGSDKQTFEGRVEGGAIRSMPAEGKEPQTWEAQRTS